MGNNNKKCKIMLTNINTHDTIGREVNSIQRGDSILINWMFAIFFTLLAMIQDIRTFRISNRLILYGIASGFFIHLLQFNLLSILSWFSGLLVPIILLFPLFYIRALGAGDIKLFSVIACFIGPSSCFPIILLSFFSCAFLSLIRLLRKGILISRYHWLFGYILCSLHRKRLVPYSSMQGKENLIHFSIPIFLSLIILFIRRCCL